LKYSDFIFLFFTCGVAGNAGYGLLTHDVLRSHTTTRQIR